MKYNIKTPSKSIEIKIDDQSYKINGLKTGNIIDIETEKVIMSRDAYDGLYQANTSDSLYARFLIDSIATFKVLIPDFVKNLTIKSPLELDIMESRIIVDAYLTQYLPWYNEWRNIFTKTNDQLAEMEKQQESEKGETDGGGEDDGVDDEERLKKLMETGGKGA